MAVYSISYDLRKSNKNYDDLYDAIKELGGWAHILDSTWLVDTTYENTSSIYKKLKLVIDDNDHIFISRVTSDHQGFLSSECVEWLNNCTF